MLACMQFRHRLPRRLGNTRWSEKGSYTGRLQRGVRATQRSGRALVTSSLYPQAAVIPTFWWEQVSNFGDLLTPFLLPTWNIVPVLTPASEAALVGVGSLIQHLPPDFSGALWGSGLIDDRRVDLPGVTALALRGDLTRDRMGGPEVMALGDPGLLIARRVKRQTPRFDVGVVPHYVHRDDAALQRLVEGFSGSVDVIDVRRHPAAVARRIAACHAIVTTSLHGLIVADSFGIPAAWVVMPTSLYGGDFKFHDHETVAQPRTARGVRLAEIDTLRDAIVRGVPADEGCIARAQDGLIRAARRIPHVTRHERVRPTRVPSRIFAAAYPSGLGRQSLPQ